MKKNLFISSALAFMALTSCQQEKLGGNTTELDGFRVRTEEMTKAVLDGVKVVFEDNDAIDIYADDAETPSVYAYNQANDIFVATGTEADGAEYTAIFPSAGADASNATVSIPSTYYGTVNSFPKAVTFMAGKSTSKELGLKHLVGLWEVDILPEYTGQKLVRCYLTVDSKYKINGVFNIDWENYTLSHKSSGDNSILMRCEYSMTKGTPVKIIFALPEGTYEGGFSFTAVTTQGSMVKKSTSPLVIRRGQITKVKNEIAYNAFESGSGTENDPYIIKTVQHWKNMANNTQSYFLLAADIDFENESVTPISTFKGTLDGGNFIVKNARIGNGTESNQSFFPMLVGTIKNIKFENITVTGGNANGVSSSAAVIVSGNNQNAFTLDNCHVTNSTVISGPYEGYTGGSYAAGLVARYNNEAAVVKNCSVSNSTISCEVENAGGVVGYIAKGILKNVISSGNTITGKGNYAGGVVGNISTANVSDIQSIGNNVNGNQYVGGLSGGVTSGSVINVKSSENTVKSTTSYSGGVFGTMANAILINAVSKDNMCIVGTSICGGVVGQCTSADGEIINIYSNGNTVKCLNHANYPYLGLIVGTNGSKLAYAVKNTLTLSGTADYVFDTAVDASKKYAGTVGVVLGYGASVVHETGYYFKDCQSLYDAKFYAAKGTEHASTNALRFATGVKQNSGTANSRAGEEKDFVAKTADELRDGTVLAALNAWVEANKETYPSLQLWETDKNNYPTLILSSGVKSLNVVELNY